MMRHGGAAGMPNALQGAGMQMMGLAPASQFQPPMGFSNPIPQPRAGGGFVGLGGNANPQ
jgi:hypothetical protein